MCSRVVFRIGCGILAAAIGASAALAQPVARGDNAVVMRIDASSSKGSAWVELVLGNGIRNAAEHVYRWSLDEPVELNAENGELIASIQALDFSIRHWSQFDLTISTTAGESETLFEISADALEFPTLPAAVAIGRTRARLHLTDLDGNGASVRGNGAPGTGAFRAEYLDAGGKEHLFAQLVGGVVCGPGGSGYGEQRDPISGYRSMKSDVRGMLFASAFRLSSNDRVVVTAMYDVNPNPPNCGADFDEDGTVDVLDLMNLLQNFGALEAEFASGDTDNDSDVDVADLSRLMNDFGSQCP